MTKLLRHRWAARLLSVLAGLAAGLAHPPFGLLPGLLGFALLMMLVDEVGARPGRSAFFRGWLAGLGYFSISVFWVTEAFLVDAATYGWMAPFALVFLAGGLGLFWGAAAWLYRVSGARGLLRPLVFAGALAGFEWLRGHVLTGFPWNLPGEAWRAGSAPSQAAALVGAYGLTWITVAIFAAPAVLRDATPRRGRLAVAGGALLALVALYAGGAARLAQPVAADPKAPVVRIVQANVDQKNKWRPENLPLIFTDYLRLSTQPGPQRPDIVIWPEGALPAVVTDLIDPRSPYAAPLAAALPPGQTLMMGANRAERDAAGQARYFNSLVALQSDGAQTRIVAHYDKFRLVPFGEFIPAGDLMGRIGVRSLVHMPDDFTAGPEPAPMILPGAAPVQPLICYEGLFPRFTGQAQARSGVRPRWILNVSNDSWFGATSGPLQHLNLASYRAIEEGLPLVRGTPTGVSAVIDPYGRIAPGHRLGLGVEGVIDARLPSALAQTPYSRFGETLFFMMVVISALAALARRIQRT